MRYGMMCTLAAAVMVAATARPATAVEPAPTSPEATTGGYVEKDSMAVQKVQYWHAPVRVRHHCRPLLRRHHHVPVYRYVYRTHHRHHWRPHCRIHRRNYHRCHSTRWSVVRAPRTVVPDRVWK